MGVYEYGYTYESRMCEHEVRAAIAESALDESRSCRCTPRRLSPFMELRSFSIRRDAACPLFQPASWTP
eukprot:9484094-Pyramimonas_sp.AAC.1